MSDNEPDYSLPPEDGVADCHRSPADCIRRAIQLNETDFAQADRRNGVAAVMACLVHHLAFRLRHDESMHAIHDALLNLVRTKNPTLPTLTPLVQDKPKRRKK